MQSIIFSDWHYFAKLMGKKSILMGDVKHLAGTEATQRMKTIVEHSRTCMFCTDPQQIPFSTRPMAVQEVDDEGVFWFFSGKDSNKNEEVTSNHKVQLLFAHPDKSEFMSVVGEATIFYDRAKVEALWNPLVKAWFTEGKDDPNLTVIRVTPEEGYYWDTKNGVMISFLKIAAGAITGKTMDDGVEGKLAV
jgi:general stress protein 26